MSSTTSRLTLPYPDETDQITDFPTVAEDGMVILDNAALVHHGILSSRSGTIPGNLYESTDVTSLAYYSSAASAYTPLLQLTPLTITTNTTAKNGQWIVVAGSSLVVSLPTATPGTLVGVYIGAGSTGTTVTAGGADIYGQGVSAGVTTWQMGTAGQACLFSADVAGQWVCVSGQFDTGWVSLTLLNSWGVLSGYYTPAARRIGDLVRLRGGLNSASASSQQIAVLPTLCQPTSSIGGLVSVDNTGHLSVGTIASLALDTVSYSSS